MQAKHIERELALVAGCWFEESAMMRLAERIRAKNIDADKKNGFYVDFDVESAAILNDSGSVMAEQAQEYLDLAQHALGSSSPMSPLESRRNRGKRSAPATESPTSAR